MANTIYQKFNFDATSIDDFTEQWYSEFVTADDQNLLNLAFTKDLSQNELDLFLANWDIEAYGGNKALLLAYILKIHTHLKAPDYVGPRLAGLLKFHRFHNLQKIAHFTKVGKKLNNESIHPMILKGGAMKFLRPEFPRLMGDIDILVQNPKEFDTACEISKNLGYDLSFEVHSVDLHLPDSEENILDIHHYIFLATDYDKKFIAELFSRATKHKVFGVESCVPSNEDMVFLALTNLAKNCVYHTSIKGMMYTLFDCKFLQETKKDFDWNIVIQNSKKTNSQIWLFLAIKFINRIIPNFLPEHVINNKTITKAGIKYAKKIMFYRIYRYETHMKCRTCDIKKIFSDFEEFKKYASTKPKHFVLKNINKSEILIDLYLKFVK